MYTNYADMNTQFACVNVSMMQIIFRPPFGFSKPFKETLCLLQTHTSDTYWADEGIIKRQKNQQKKTVVKLF